MSGSVSACVWAYSPCWPSSVGVPVRGAVRRWACARAECSPSPGRGRYGGTCARAYCRPGCRAPGSRTARSFGRRSHWATWPDAPRRTRPPLPQPPVPARAPLAPLACLLWLLPSARLPLWRAELNIIKNEACCRYFYECKNPLTGFKSSINFVSRQ